MTTDNRRAPGAARIPFEAIVEVGGALGPSFEAQAVNMSEDGMHLRTAYLPEIGQPLSCRFETTTGQIVLATGEVLWKEEAGKGGEFGVKFTGLDPESTEALHAMFQPREAAGSNPPAPAPQARGSRVRLHIEGLNSPMRAHVRDARPGKVTTTSGLGFLQVGKQVNLEDAASGAKRPARVVRVECEVNRESRVPQLVMSFEYADERVPASEELDETPKEATPEPMVTHDGVATKSAAEREIERASDEMKGFVARTATRVTPALEKMVGRAKTTFSLLTKGQAREDEGAAPPRRRTSPPPQGGLHASGRRVVRDSLPPSAKDAIASGPLPVAAYMTKKRMAVAGGAVAVLLLGAIALHKPSHADAPAASNDAPAASPAAVASAPTTADAPLAAPPSVFQPVAPGAARTMDDPSLGATEVASSNDVLDDPSDRRHPARVAPFSNGPVSHGNVLRLKMDGPIDKIEGDSQPTGFTVVLPGRKSIEPASPLAARDGRIASIRVTNDPGGAELTLAFKDGVPNYLVRRSKESDVLEVVLAPNSGRADRADRADRPEHTDRTERPAVHPVSTHHRRHHHG